MLEIDGSAGEGGGQILRSALSLSLLTGTAFRVHSIRARRSNPGLQRQHLAAVKAAAEVGRAEIRGAAIGSRDLVFRPGLAEPGTYSFAVGTAGSATLVLQTVLPPLLAASGPSALAFEGGTHNRWAPPYDFLERAFLPVLGRMGATVEVRLERRGFYPVGGGRISAKVTPSGPLRPIDLVERGSVRAIRATAIVSRLPASIGERELRVVEERLSKVSGKVVEDRQALGPGNVLLVEVDCEGATAVFTGFGEKGVPAEEVAAGAAREAEAWIDLGVPVDEHLSDQLLLPFAMAGGGSFVTGGLSGHASTNMDVIRTFLGTRFEVETLVRGARRISVR